MTCVCVCVQKGDETALFTDEHRSVTVLTAEFHGSPPHTHASAFIPARSVRLTTTLSAPRATLGRERKSEAAGRRPPPSPPRVGGGDGAPRRGSWLSCATDARAGRTLAARAAPCCTSPSA